ncbi:MarR family winged helix-turn-helix transcriptional regulator [Actinomadura sp. WMMB 499]|uniref:MarR family winged helix-turn-helix transcriptional regulator n=1 Tax=Actinomadura sp. WMMB 499 TaxID=1219491 RepID=UPI00159D3900|nr:MarR family winged helix-turn-helix transcriptional regulator [Actinomadura sp. WMMB 499]
MTGLEDAAPEAITVDVMRATEHLVSLWETVRADATPFTSGSQFDCLRAIDRQAGLTLNELADALTAAPSSVSRLCDRLQAADLVTKETPTVDRRRTTLFLTHHGQQLLHQIACRRRRLLAALVAQMSTSGRVALLHGLSDLQSCLNATRLRDVPGDNGQVSA